MFRTWGPATVLLLTLAIIVVAVGGIVVIVQPDTLTFAQYLDDLKTFGLALAGLAVGRGIHLGLQGDNAPGGGLDPEPADLDGVKPDDSGQAAKTDVGDGKAAR